MWHDKAFHNDTETLSQRENIQKIMKEQLRKNTNAVKWIFSDMQLFPALMSKGFCSMSVKHKNC